MGAYDDGGMTRSVAAASSIKDSTAIDKFRSAQKELDKALADPKTSISKLNKLTDKLAKTLSAVIDYTEPSKTTNIDYSNSFTPSLYDEKYNKPTPIPQTPSQPVVPVIPPPPAVKTAPIDTILFNDETMPIEIMTDLIFENIGGQELIDIARNDTINGQSVIYQPIKNLNTIQQRYNPNNILAVQQTSDKYFEGYTIKLEEKIPYSGNGTYGENIYIEAETGDLIIELVNIYDNEQVESEISINGTIYEADI